MASFNRKINISGEFRVVGKAFKPQEEKTIDGVKTVYPDRFELYVLYCDSEKDGLYTDKPFVGTAKVELKDFVSTKGEKTLKGKGSIFGDLLTITELECMTGNIARKDCKSSKAEICVYNDGGFSLSTNFEHLVFADYKIQARHGKVRSWDMDGFEYGLPDPKHTTAFLPPYSRLFFDEAQKYLNSRRSGLADSVSRAYEFHRHMHYNITLVMLRPKLIDLNVRELSEHVIEVVELEHEYDHDCIVGSVWYCREYDNVAVALKSIDGQSVEYEKTRYEFDGNIYKHYSSFAQAPAFYNGRYASDFTLMDAADYGRSIEDVARFNREHSYALPKGYYE